MLVLAIIGYTFLAIYEFVPLYKQKLWYDFWTNAALGFFSFIITILLCLNVHIPSPEKPIREFIISIFGK
ncbi:membrane protein [Clostridium carboxidivorans P7]|uniref:hypothetical protein n=1 Tax=Clostridium carboxidivorans TaxID=217159 RepID=UPI0005571682|nr:hypothetical protein [Clostridium carboxidivorans]AKN31386.1 membrane protein [Clostridium carboxidivorans P7]